ncbi:MAG TPA: PEP/pyruvate-binding domain-containing protein [Micromonosporaceae bacterium]
MTPDPDLRTRAAPYAVRWLVEPTAWSAAGHGDELAALARLSGQHRVPAGFCVTAPPLWIDADGLLLPSIGPLAEAYRRLAATGGPAVDVCAVVPQEYLEPGRRPRPWTFRNVAGAEALVTAVTECLAPYPSARMWHNPPAPRPASTEQASLSPAAAEPLAVLVRRFVAARVSAIACTMPAGPTGGAAVLIRATWGVGEGLRDRVVGADTFLLGAGDLTVLRRRLADKRVMAVPAGGGLAQMAVPSHLRRRRCLTDAQARQIAHIGLDAQRELGVPAQIEVATDRTGLWLLRVERGPI